MRESKKKFDKLLQNSTKYGKSQSRQCRRRRSCRQSTDETAARTNGHRSTWTRPARQCAANNQIRRARPSSPGKMRAISRLTTFDRSVVIAVPCRVEGARDEKQLDRVVPALVPGFVTVFFSLKSQGQETTVHTQTLYEFAPERWSSDRSDDKSPVRQSQ